MRSLYLLAVLLAAFLLVAPVMGEDVSSADTFTETEREAINQSAEKYEFQAEVGRLMDILIKYLYSNKEIFLRELISNGSDALDKIRFLALTDPDQLASGDKLQLEIRGNKDKKTLSIRDYGVGMTKEELIRNLGTVAKSGTTQFVEKMTAGAGQDSMSLIGQFGVGFYSVYLVADTVTVVSKSNNSTKQFIWESSAHGTFTVSEDPRGNTLGRGSEITLQLKADASEFAEYSTLKRIATKYSEFINFPIYLEQSKHADDEVPIDPEEVAAAEAKKAEAAAKAGEEGVSVEDELKEEDKPRVKRVPKTVYELQLINENKPIWSRNPKEVTDAEYIAFYKALTKDVEEPLSWVHFSAEGDVAFKALLYIPKKPASDLYDKYYGKSSSIKLYVRRVLIAEEFEDFMPRYLNFIRGVVDSDDLPLNVNRETLQKNKLLQVIGKKLVNKVFNQINQLNEKPENEEIDENDVQGDSEKFSAFLKAFGRSIRLGLLEDQRNSKKLQALLRFPTSVSNPRTISLQTYVDRMKPKQEAIYYIAGESLAAIQASPFLEKLKRRKLEVLLLAEPLDEYAIQQLSDFEGKKLQSITKEGLSFGKDDEKIKARLERLNEEFKDLCKYLEVVYGSSKVEKVVVSARLHDTPAILVTSQYGWSANMERIMKAQALGDNSRQNAMIAKRTLEINPRHPIIEELKHRVASRGDNESQLKDLANLLYDAAAMNSGFTVDDAKIFGDRIHRVIANSLNVGGVSIKDEEEEESADAESEETRPEEEVAQDEEDSKGHDEL